ncbi:holo-ACP synthase [Candidatus Bipolaricaulota bacterium]|nr:holo-ACP synthase [Candidatus Bipolaricaulota bacterium]
MAYVGVDLVEVARIRDLALRRGKRALERLFTPRELAYALAACPSVRFQRLAARFAAKEAFRKAMDHPVPFREMEVVRENGRPRLRWRGRDYPLTISHTAALAVAVVLVEDVTPPLPSPQPGPSGAPAG